MVNFSGLSGHSGPEYSPYSLSSSFGCKWHPAQRGSDMNQMRCLYRLSPVTVLLLSLSGRSRLAPGGDTLVVGNSPDGLGNGLIPLSCRVRWSLMLEKGLQCFPNRLCVCLRLCNAHSLVGTRRFLLHLSLSGIVEESGS